MTHQAPQTLCCQTVPRAVPHPLAATQGPCGDSSVARHPGCEERYDGICRYHLNLYGESPFLWTVCVPANPRWRGRTEAIEHAYQDMKVMALGPWVGRS